MDEEKYSAITSQLGALERKLKPKLVREQPNFERRRDAAMGFRDIWAVVLCALMASTATLAFRLGG
jgi:hypothetical protein